MPRWQPVKIVGGSYSDDAKPYSVQDTVNWLPVVAEAEGTRSGEMLRNPPGLRPFVGIGDRHRGARNVEGRLFVVSGERLWQVTGENAATELGTIPGRSLVSMTHNQITDGNQLVIGTGDAGYVWNTVTETLTQITDDGFPGFLCCDYINSLVIGIEPARRFWFNSALADATDYNALERYESEASPDRLRGLIVSHLETWLLNENTIEVFENTGETNALFQNKRIVIETGCAATNSIKKIDNSIVFLGHDGSVYATEGYGLRRISTHPIEQDIADLQWHKAFAFVWADRGHKVYYLTFPDGKTWGFDFATRQWHRRQSYGLDRWRLSTMVQWEGDWYGGEYNGGILYRLDWDYPREGADPMVRERTTPVLHDHQNRVIVNALELVLDVGPDVDAISANDNILALAVTGDLPDGSIGYIPIEYYTATGGMGAYTYSVSAGAMPTGVTLDPATGTVSGSYTTNGTFTWTIMVEDEIGNTATVEDTAVVRDAPILLVISQTHEYQGGDYSDMALSVTAQAPVPASIGGRAADGSVIAQADGSNNLEIWRWSNSAAEYQLCTISGTIAALVASSIVLVSHDGEWVYTTRTNGSGFDWYAYHRTGTTTYTLITQQVGVFTSQDREVCLSPDSSQVLVAWRLGGNDHGVASINPTTGELGSWSSRAYMGSHCSWAGDYYILSRSAGGNSSDVICNANDGTVAIDYSAVAGASNERSALTKRDDVYIVVSSCWDSPKYYGKSFLANPTAGTLTLVTTEAVGAIDGNFDLRRDGRAFVRNSGLVCVLAADGSFTEDGAPTGWANGTSCPIWTGLK